MFKSESPASIIEVLIQLHPDARAFRRVVAQIEGLGGGVILAYPPQSIVASLPFEAIHELNSDPGIQSVDTREIDEERLRDAPEDARMAMITWNQRIARQHVPVRRPATGLPWDAAGRLAPDPPPEIQEMLRRREREMSDGVDDEPSD